MDMVSFCGLIGLCMMESFSIIILRAEEFISGLMEEFMRDSGRKIKCMERGLLGGWKGV